MSEICRLVIDSDHGAHFESAIAADYPLTTIIQDDKKYGYMKLPNGVFTYKFHGKPPRGLEWWQVEKAINNAVRRFIPYIRDYKKTKVIRDDGPALFNIYAHTRKEDPYLTANTIMYHWYPIAEKRGICVLNNDMFFSLNGREISAHVGDPANYPDPNTSVTFATFDFDAVYSHELGHGWFGLPHDPVPNTTMYSTVDKMTKFLDPRTIERVQAKAGKRRLTEQYLRDFINRLIIYSDN